MFRKIIRFLLIPVLSLWMYKLYDQSRREGIDGNTGKVHFRIKLMSGLIGTKLFLVVDFNR